MTRRRGFSIVEILLAIMLFGFFGVIAMRLFRANFQVARATFTADNDSARFDGAVAALRADLAGSSSCEMTEPGLLRIHLPGNEIADWRTDMQGPSRKQGADARTWSVGQSLNLKMDGPIVLLSSRDDPAIQIAFAPSKSSAEGGQR